MSVSPIASQCKMNQDRVIRKGSDPLTQTARGKLQTQRQKLNEKMNKELRMRDGAENLYKAAEKNRKLQIRVGLELSYFNSNIQLLKEQLSEMNSSVDVYQHENSGSNTPMIPLGLKETTVLDFSTAFQDEILEHYSEDGEKYKSEMKDLFDLREAVRTPERSHAGVELLMEYFNQLVHIEKRFFSSRRRIPVFFQWYDCLTGVPGSQKSIGFEKGSILYNIGALYTQIACRQDRATKEGIIQSIVNFEKAAGSFKYLDEHFNAAPSQDMQHETLSMLVSLMLAQAQECVLEGRLTTGSKDSLTSCVQLAQEASMVSQNYADAHKKMSSEPMKSYLPFSWLAMCETKKHFYRGLGHYYLALAVLDHKENGVLSQLREVFVAESCDDSGDLNLPSTEEERKHFGRAHLRESVINHEESIRIHNLCRQLRKIDTFRDILENIHERALKKFSSLEEEDDFSEALTVLDIIPKSEHTAVPVGPDFSKVKVVDIFWKLGPVGVFCASNDWSAPRTVILERGPDEGFGFSVRGDAPVVIADMEDNSVAMKSGMKVGDCIVGIGSVDTKWCKHEEVVTMVRHATQTLSLTLITPAPKPVPSPDRPGSVNSQSHIKIEGQTTSEHDKKNQNRISTPWMFMRRNSGKDKNGAPARPVSTSSPLLNGNVKHTSNGSLTAGQLLNGADVEL